MRDHGAGVRETRPDIAGEGGVAERFEIQRHRRGRILAQTISAVASYMSLLRIVCVCVRARAHLVHMCGGGEGKRATKCGCGGVGTCFLACGRVLHVIPPYRVRVCARERERGSREVRERASEREKS